MKGPYKLSSNNIRRRVDPKIGVYLLRNTRRGPVKYVGMSTDLVDRLRRYLGQYSFFSYEYQPSERQAYIRETNLYHHHGGKKRLDNDRHPPRPHRQVKCQWCGIHD